MRDLKMNEEEVRGPTMISITFKNMNLEEPAVDKHSANTMNYNNNNAMTYQQHADVIDISSEKSNQGDAGDETADPFDEIYEYIVADDSNENSEDEFVPRVNVEEEAKKAMEIEESWASLFASDIKGFVANKQLEKVKVVKSNASNTGNDQHIPQDHMMDQDARQNHNFKVDLPSDLSDYVSDASTSHKIKKMAKKSSKSPPPNHKDVKNNMKIQDFFQQSSNKPEYEKAQGKRLHGCIEGDTETTFPKPKIVKLSTDVAVSPHDVVETVKIGQIKRPSNGMMASTPHFFSPAQTNAQPITREIDAKTGKECIVIKDDEENFRRPAVFSAKNSINLLKNRSQAPANIKVDIENIPRRPDTAPPTLLIPHRSLGNTIQTHNPLEAFHTPNVNDIKQAQGKTVIDLESDKSAGMPPPNTPVNFRDSPIKLIPTSKLNHLLLPVLRDQKELSEFQPPINNQENHPQNNQTQYAFNMLSQHPQNKNNNMSSGMNSHTSHVATGATTSSLIPKTYNKTLPISPQNGNMEFMINSMKRINIAQAVANSDKEIIDLENFDTFQFQNKQGGPSLLYNNSLKNNNNNNNNNDNHNHNMNAAPFKSTATFGNISLLPPKTEGVKKSLFGFRLQH
jgi:hypothetical protein